MTMRNHDEIDVFERGDFVLRIFENRIREPRIDEQNFSARGHNLESRLTVPSELRVHGNHRTKKISPGKRDQEKNDEARMTNNSRNPNIVGRFCETPRRLTQTRYSSRFVITSVIRHS